MRRESSDEPWLIPSNEFVFPNTNYLPAELAEGAGDEAVAGPVGGDLLPPEGRVVPGLDEMPRAPVPEAAVDEHR
jgi:hypothetical protein